MLAEQVRACVSVRPHQPSLWRSHTKPRRSPDVASPWEQGRLLRCAAAWRWRRSCDLAVTLEEEVEELMSCWTGEQACARVCCAAPPQAFWRSPGMARWPTTCAATKITNHQAQRALSWSAAQSTPARPLFVRPFSSLPAGMGPMSILDSPSRAALHLRGAYTSARTPYHQPNPLESQSRTWMPGGPAETPLYGWSWPSTTKLLGRMIGQARRPRYVVLVLLYCRTPLFVLLRHTHLPCDIHYSPPPHTRVTILLCIPSLPCWHDHPFTIVIHHNHQRDPASRYSTFFSRSFYLHNNISNPSHEHATGWQPPQTHAEHQPRHTQTFSTLHHHVIYREPAATPESCAPIRLRWQP